MYVRMIFSLCRHKKLRAMRTMYAVNQRYANSFQFYAYSDIILLKLLQNDNFSTFFVWLLCQQLKGTLYNVNVAFDCSIFT